MDTNLLKGLLEISPFVISASIGIAILSIPAILRFSELNDNNSKEE